MNGWKVRYAEIEIDSFGYSVSNASEGCQQKGLDYKGWINVYVVPSWKFTDG